MPFAKVGDGVWLGGVRIIIPFPGGGLASLLALPWAHCECMMLPYIDVCIIPDLFLYSYSGTS